MTHTKDEALKLALEALTRYVNEDDICEGMPGNEPWVETKYMGEAAITAIKQALAAPTVQEPDHLREFKKDMLRANYQPKSEATFGFKEYGYYVDKDGNGKIGVLPK